MGTFLFDNIVFGPVSSRRLGASLGINLLPTTEKLCSYNCVYCECGLNDKSKPKLLPPYNVIIEAIEKKFIELADSGLHPDAVTFAGNGEPTLHPNFLDIIKETVRLRNKYLGNSDIVVLTNAAQLDNSDVVTALNMVDKPILKIDTLIQEDFEIINGPLKHINIEDLPRIIKKSFNKIFIQTMFLKGEINNKYFDNSSAHSLEKYYSAMEFLQPTQIMVYSIARDTPYDKLYKLTKQELDKIATVLISKNINVLVTP